MLAERDHGAKPVPFLVGEVDLTLLIVVLAQGLLGVQVFQRLSAVFKINTMVHGLTMDVEREQSE